MNETFEKMDRMYRFQRHFYDLTRKYYLFGRDKLLQEIAIGENKRILEIGCGTGRNLIILSRKLPAAELFGLDASAAMIETARRKTRSKGIRNITFIRALADNFSYRETFGLSEPFDAIFFSYSLSMIPTWQQALKNAFQNLAPGGGIHCVDFFDMAGLPRPFAATMHWWLSKFGVSYRAGIDGYLNSLNPKGPRAKFKPLYGGYCCIASIRRG
jgi:S-adenosylmethionine-diacylgycerolhomoserine-N-methlytransferase